MCFFLSFIHWNLELFFRENYLQSFDWRKLLRSSIQSLTREREREISSIPIHRNGSRDRFGCVYVDSTQKSLFLCLFPIIKHTALSSLCMFKRDGGKKIGLVSIIDDLKTLSLCRDDGMIQSTMTFWKLFLFCRHLSILHFLFIYLFYSARTEMGNRVMINWQQTNKTVLGPCPK